MKQLLLIHLLPVLLLIGCSTGQAHAQTAQWDWVQQMQARNGSGGYATAVAPGGNIITAGPAGGLTVFATDTTYGLCSFIARYDSANGNLLWHKVLTPSHAADSQGYEVVVITDLALDAAGNIYVTGLFSDSLTLDTAVLVSVYGPDVFTASFSPSGQLRWARRAGGTLPSWGNPSDFMGDQVRGIAVSPNGWVYIAGSAMYEITFEGQTFYTNNFASNAFIACYDSTGQFQWMSYGLGGETKAIEAVADNFLYCTTWQNGVQAVGKFNSAGTLVSAYPVTAPGSYGLWGHGLVVDAQENIYLTGEFWQSITLGSTTYLSPERPSLALIKLDNTGQMAWHQVVLSNGVMGSVIGKALAIDPEGTVLVTGEIIGNANFGGAQQISNTQKKDIFVACYSGTGSALWVRKAGGLGNEMVYAIVAPAKGTAYLTGHYARPATFGTSVLTGLTTNYDDAAHYFLARISGITITGMAQEPLEQGSFQLYPNPAASMLHLQWPAGADGSNSNLRLYNSTGQLVLERPVLTDAIELALPVGHLPAGLYLAELQTQQQTLRQRWVKQ